MDADFTLFQACSAVEREAIFTNESGAAVHVLNSAFDEALATFERSVQGYIKNLKGQEAVLVRSEEHTSELQSLMRISYAVFCLKKKKINSKTVGQQRSLTHQSDIHTTTRGT